MILFTKKVKIVIILWKKLLAKSDLKIKTILDILVQAFDLVEVGLIGNFINIELLIDKKNSII